MRYPVLQPDGKLAVWGTVTDNFVALDCSREEAIRSILDWHTRAERAAARAVDAVLSGERPQEHWNDWIECVAWIMARDGAGNEIVKEALDLTPDPLMRRCIETEVRQIEAEGEADDLRYEAMQLQSLVDAEPITAILNVLYTAKTYNHEHGLGWTQDFTDLDAWLSKHPRVPKEDKGG